MNNLIHRLEAAEGPSRELDGLIHAAIGRVERGFNVHKLNPSLPAYTASLDAAVSLVEAEGWGWEIDSLDPGEPSAIVARSGICEADTPILALLIAFFKAKDANA